MGFDWKWRLAWFMGFDQAVEIGWVLGFDRVMDSAWLDFEFWIQIGWFGGGVVVVTVVGG